MTLETAPPRSTRALLLSFFLIFSLLSLCGLSALLVVLILVAPRADPSEQLIFSLLAGGLFFSAMLLLPAIFINIRLYFRLPSLNLRFPPISDSIVFIILGIFWALTLVLGQLIASTTLAPIFLPFLNILAVVLPVIFLLRIAVRKLESPSMQQAWSIFAVTLVIAPVLGTLLEGLAFVIFLFAGAFFVSSDPTLARQISHVMEIAQQNGSSEALMTALTPMLFTPIGMSITFGLLSFAVPIIEESVKVLALWLFADQIKHPAQGFVLGALCGAAFALAENVGFSSTGASEWTQSVIQRAAAILPHTLNSGILGWALVSAWRERAWFKLGGAYLAVILIHGTWNGISVALALSGLTAYASPAVAALFANAAAFETGEMIMILGSLGGLIYCNSVLRRSQPALAEYNEPLLIDTGDKHGDSETTD